MEPSPDDIVLALLPLLALVGLFALAAFWISRRTRMREFAHREWLAMIEKGLVPPAELYPGGRPVAMVDRALSSPQRSRIAMRFRSAGVMLVGLGVALALIIGVTARLPHVGLGVGGALAAIGVAMIANAVLDNRGTPGDIDPASHPPDTPAE